MKSEINNKEIIEFPKKKYNIIYADPHIIILLSLKGNKKNEKLKGGKNDRRI